MRALAIDPAGAVLAAGTYTGTVGLWDLDLDSAARELSGHDAGTVVRRIGFSRDGARLVSAGDDGTARIWRVASGQPARVLRHGAVAVWAAAFVADDTLVLTGDYHGSLRIWNAQAGTEIERAHPGRALKRSPHADPFVNFMNLRAVRSASATRAGDLVALGIEGFDPIYSPVVVWDVATKRVVETLAGHDGALNQVWIAPDGSTVTSVAHDRRMLRWRLRDAGGGVAAASAREAYDFQDQAFDLAVDDHGRHFALGLSNGEVVIWDSQRRAVVRRLASYGGTNLASIAYNPRRALVARGLVDGTIDVMAVHLDLTELLRWPLEHRLVRDLACAERASIGMPDTAACRGGTPVADRPASLRDAVAAAAPPALRPARAATAILAPPVPADRGADPGLVLSPTNAFTVSGRVAVHDVAVRPEAAEVLLAVHTWRSEVDHEPRIAAYGVDDGRLRATWRPHSSDIFALAVTDGDSGLISAGGPAIRASRWDAPDAVGGPLGSVDSDVYTLAAAPTGDVVAYGSFAQLGVWERRTDGERGTPSTGRLAVAGGDAGELTIWDVATGAVRQRVAVGESTIYFVEISPDGLHLALSDDSGVVRLYDVAAAADGPVRLMPGHASNRVPIAFLDGGCRMASVDAGVVRVWDLEVCPD